MANPEWFTKLDPNRGYWQIPLDEESQLFTTFSSPFRRFCYQVTPFGIKSAQEVFQKGMSHHFGDLEGVEIDIDDTIVHADTEMKHVCNLNSVLDRCKKMNGKMCLQKQGGGLPWSQTYTRGDQARGWKSSCH